MDANRPIDRLLIYLADKKIGNAKAEQILSLGNAYIKNSQKRNGAIGSDILQKIGEAFVDLNLLWIINGKGEMLTNVKNDADTPTPTDRVNEPKPGYSTNTPTPTGRGNNKESEKSVRPTVHPTASFEAKAIYLAPQIITVDRQGNDNIVYVNAKAAAGYLLGYSDPEFIENLPSFTLPGLHDSSYRAFQVDGDSMYPTLENKELIIGQWVEKLDYIREDRVHIIVTKTQGIIVKRLLNRIEKYGYIIAKSDATDNRNLYPNIEINPNEVVEIWYAVWHGSFNFKSPTELYKKVNNLEADLTEVLRVLKANKLLG